MLILEKIHRDSQYFQYIRDLYESSFPDDEKRDFNELISGQVSGSDFYAVLRKNTPVGLISCLTYNDITHILYFAVDKRFRNRGYGSEILSLVSEIYGTNRIIADLEEPVSEAENLDEREKRIDFYLDNNYRFTEINYEWQGERYIIVSRNGDVSREEFSKFWEHFKNVLP